MKMNFELSRVNDKIYLHFDYHGGIIKIGITDYTDEIWKLVQSSKWNITKNPNYIFSNKYKKYLHQIIMAYWYELDCCKKMNENNFVIDHIDNDGFNCVSENLVFLKAKKNRFYKGNFYDGLRKEKIPVAALNIFNNFKTEEYQITIGFNQHFTLSSTKEDISKLFFLYKNKDYDLVLADALRLLESIDNGKLAISEMRFNYWRYEPVQHIIVPRNIELKGGEVVKINGTYHMIKGENLHIIRISPDPSGLSTDEAKNLF